MNSSLRLTLGEDRADQPTSDAATAATTAWSTSVL